MYGNVGQGEGDDWGSEGCDDWGVREVMFGEVREGMMIGEIRGKVMIVVARKEVMTLIDESQRYIT